MNILLITNDSSVISLIKHSLKKAAANDRLFITRSGKEGIEFLNKSLNSQLDLIPSLVIIDLDSPEANGLHVIQRVTTDLRIEGTQVAVLTSPLEQRDAENFERLDLDYIIEKPLEHKAIKELFETLQVELFEESETIEIQPGLVKHPTVDKSIQRAGLSKISPVDDEDLRRVLVIEPNVDERKRLNQGFRKGSVASLNFEFTANWNAAKGLSQSKLKFVSP